MTTPAHDSVAYLPARPRLALLRKEADQLKLCLPYPTLRPKDQCDLCFGGGAAARFLPAGGSGRAVPFSRLRVIWLPIGRLLAVADHPSLRGSVD